MKLTAVLSLQDNYTPALKKAINETIRFRSELGKTKTALDDTFKKKYSMQFGTNKAQAKNNSHKKRNAKDKALKVKLKLVSNQFKKDQQLLLDWLKKTVASPFRVVFKPLDLITSPIKTAVDKSMKMLDRLKKEASNGFKLVVNAADLKIKLDYAKGRFDQVKKTLSKPFKLLAEAADFKTKLNYALGIINQVKNAASKRFRLVFETVGLAIDPIKNKINSMKSMFDRSKKAVAAPIKFIFKAVDLVTAPLKAIFSGIKTVFSWLFSGMKKAFEMTKNLVTESLKGASSLEQTSLTVEHFIKLNNKGMSSDKVKQEADKYMAGFRTAPELTGFDNKEVQSAGERAIAVAQGNTNEATNLLRLAADMSAVTPGKSISDALDALADMKKGEGDSMQDFGYYVKESSIKAAGKDLGKVQNREGIALKDAFKGGGAKEAKSAAGLWTSIKNGLNNGIADMGKDTLEILKPMLKSWSDLLRSDGAKKMFAAGSKLMAGVAKAVVKTSDSILGWLNRNFLNNVEFQNTDSLKEKFVFALDKLKEGLNDWYKDTGGPLFTDLINNVKNILLEKAESLKEPAKKLAKEIGQGILEGLDEFRKDHPILTGITSFLMTPGPPQLKAAVGAVQMAQGYYDQGVDKVYNKSGFKDWGSNLYKTWSEKLDPMPLLDGINSVMYKIHGITPPEKISNEIVESRYGNFNKQAIGLTRVPYDNYPALLHENERVLTAQEARTMNNNSSVTINLSASKQVDPDINRLMAALKSAVESAGFNMAPGGVPA